jgi:hypothetical protein
MLMNIGGQVNCHRLDFGAAEVGGDTDSKSGISGLVRFVLGFRKIISVKTKWESL